ncbi:UNVERIFIED_CONTAM: hypothetical protein FKN15_040123 [Acipenser sinensis]
MKNTIPRKTDCFYNDNKAGDKARIRNGSVSHNTHTTLYPVGIRSPFSGADCIVPLLCLPLFPTDRSCKAHSEQHNGH